MFTNLISVIGQELMLSGCVQIVFLREVFSEQGTNTPGQSPVLKSGLVACKKLLPPLFAHIDLPSNFVTDTGARLVTFPDSHFRCSPGKNV